MIAITANHNDIEALDGNVEFNNTKILSLQYQLFLNELTEEEITSDIENTNNYINNLINNSNNWLNHARRQYDRWGQWSSFRNIDWNFIQPIPPLELPTTNQN